MYNRILVGLDGSQHALQAADAALEIAEKFGSEEVHFLTVTRPYKVSPALKRFLQAENLIGEPKYVMDEMTMEIIDEAREHARRRSYSKIKTATREGKPARAIVEYAKHNRIDLIVLGSRGVGEMEAVLIGSVSQKVSMLAKSQLLIVR